MTAIMTLVLMFITRPFWMSAGPVGAAISTMFAVGVSAVSSKMILGLKK